MRIGGVILGLSAAIVVAITSTHLFLSPDPELVVLTSADGMMRMTGRAYDADRLTLVAGEVQLGVPLIGVAYTIAPEEYTFLDGVSLVFSESSGPLALYRLHPEEGYWEPVASPVYQENGEARVVIHRAGTYALGESLDVVLPTFVDVLDELRGAMHPQVVAYDVDVLGYIHENTPILIARKIEHGGCGGVPAVGDVRTFSRTSRTAEIMVNDVRTLMTLIFSLVMTSTEQGCAENAPLAPIF